MKKRIILKATLGIVVVSIMAGAAFVLFQPADPIEVQKADYLKEIEASITTGEQGIEKKVEMTDQISQEVRALAVINQAEYETLESQVIDIYASLKGIKDELRHRGKTDQNVMAMMTQIESTLQEIEAQEEKLAEKKAIYDRIAQMPAEEFAKIIKEKEADIVTQQIAQSTGE